jgi:outer membrane immunogenic protein
MASVSVVTLAGTAFAADLAPPPPPPPPVPLFTWTGPYAGGQVGYAWGKDTASIGDFLGNYASTSYTTSGVIGGAHVGYNIQLSQFVIGLEGDVNGSSLNKIYNLNPFVPYFSAIGNLTNYQSLTYSAKSNVSGAIVGRVGYAWDHVLLYALGGVAFAGTTLTLQAGYPTYTYDQADNARVGWTVGGGLEYAIDNNWSIRAEYRYAQFGTQTLYAVNYGVGNATLGSLGDAGAYVNRKFNTNSVQVGFSYKFVTAPPPPAVPAVTK